MSETRPSATAVTSRTLNRLRARGPREVIRLGWDRIRDWASSSDELIMFVRETSHEGDDNPGVTFRAASTADADRYALEIGTDSPSTFRKRLTESTHCFVVDEGRVLLHASWVTTQGAWTRELRAELTPPAGGAYIYESFTRSEARGRGIYPFALRQIASWGKDAGLQKVWVAVEADNPASLRAITKAGFAEAFRLPYQRRIGRLRIGEAAGPHADAAATFVSRSRP